MKDPYIIYADLVSSLEKRSTCHNNPKRSSTNKINQHTPSGYSFFTQCWFDATKNKIVCNRSKDCMKRFCKDLKERTTAIINYPKKEMIPPSYEENQSYNKQKKLLYMQNKA